MHFTRSKYTGVVDFDHKILLGKHSGLFSKHTPSLIEFVEIVEKESRYYADKLNDIRHGREDKPKYKERTIPTIPQEYLDYMED